MANHAQLTVSDIRGPYMQLLTNLQGKDASTWLNGLNRFLCRKNPWEAYIIDCDADPSTLAGRYVNKLELAEHSRDGLWEWDPLEVTLRTFGKEGTFEEEEPLSSMIFEEVRGKALNANVLDYLLARPRLIPEEWKQPGDDILFLGTLYRFKASPVQLDARTLRWCHTDKAGKEWKWESGMCGVTPNIRYNRKIAVRK